MSSPVRQMNTRRLPPLPGKNKITSSERPVGHLQDNPPVEMDPDLVTQYLKDNPMFLEQYVMNNCSRRQLEHWLIKQTAGKEEINGLENNRRTSLSRWKFCVHADKRKMLQDLTRDIHHYRNKAQVLSELAHTVATAVNSDGFNLYLVDESLKSIYHFNPPADSNQQASACVRQIGQGSSLAAYVAFTKSPLRVKEILGDERFPEGICIGAKTAQCAIAHPIIQSNGELAGVVELYRNVGKPLFGEEDEELIMERTLVAPLLVDMREMYHSMIRQRKLNDFLLTVTKSIFQDIVSMDTVIMKIMNFAKRLVSADRAALFLLDVKTKELYARIFDTGKPLEVFDDDSSDKEIRFPMDKGIAGHVASTGEVLNITDAYRDERFNRDVDQQTGYTTKTILCMPIFIRGSTIGVVQMVNKLNGTFTKADEQSFETFAIYCGLALHHAKLYDKIRKSEQKYRVALDVLTYHIQCPEDEYDLVRRSPLPDVIPRITEYDFSPWDVAHDGKPIHVVYMLKDLFGMMSCADSEPRFDIQCVVRFTLTVRKNYRHVPYHNWAHAFSVAHSMYTIIKTASHQFSPLQSLALFVACLCHDLDHRGKTNAFMVKSASPLAAIYTTSVMEHHHFNQTVTILQNESNNIFKNLTPEEYKEILSDIKHCIIATDLALFFGNRARLKDIVDKGEFTWDNKEHNDWLMGVAMTGGDLCSMFKPWPLSKDLVLIIMEEFWQQGDEEKKQGNVPIPMMDRDKRDELPQSQVGFIMSICLPCYELLAEIMPETYPTVEGARANLEKWREMVTEKEAAGQ